MMGLKCPCSWCYRAPLIPPCLDHFSAHRPHCQHLKLCIHLFPEGSFFFFSWLCTSTRKTRSVRNSHPREALLRMADRSWRITSWAPLPWVGKGEVFILLYLSGLPRFPSWIEPKLLDNNIPLLLASLPCLTFLLPCIKLPCQYITYHQNLKVSESASGESQLGDNQYKWWQFGVEPHWSTKITRDLQDFSLKLHFSVNRKVEL